MKTKLGEVYIHILKGTAEFEKVKIEKRTLNDNEFKKLDKNNFRTKNSSKIPCRINYQELQSIF